MSKEDASFDTTCEMFLLLVGKNSAKNQFESYELKLNVFELSILAFCFVLHIWACLGHPYL